MNEISDQELFKKGVENYKNKNFSKAKEIFEKVLNNNSKNFSILENLSLVYHELKMYSEAENTLKKIIKLGKKDIRIFNFLFKVLKEQDKMDELEEFINLGIKEVNLNKRYNFIRYLIFPQINIDNKEIVSRRNRIENFIDKFNESEEVANLDIDKEVIDCPTFYYSYDQFDNLNLNKKFNTFFKKIYPVLNQNDFINKNKNRRVKIGFISEFFSNHTISKLFKGLILKLNREKFEVNVFHLETTKKSQDFSNYLEEEIKSDFKNIILPKKFNEKIKIIKNSGLDIIFYPDIGMSNQLYFLTFLRLAKFQITSWGHPETTGNSKIDYFLSSKLIETNDAQEKYSEKLVLFNNLPMYYYKPKIYNILSDEEICQKNIYSCSQTLVKIHPDFDQIIKKILEKDPAAKIYFVKDKNYTLYKKLSARLKKNVVSNMDKIIFVDQMTNENWINFCGKASVLLDPLYFGSGNSFHESMFYGTPTVSLPSEYMKSRIVYGAYKQMKIDNPPIVNSIDEYVSKAIELANYNEKNILDNKKNLQNSADKFLYENSNFLNEIEDFLLNL